MSAPAKKTNTRLLRRCLWGVLGLGGLYLALLLPERSALPFVARSQPFAWKRDAFWTDLEGQYRAARAQGCEALRPQLDRAFADFRQTLDSLRSTNLAPTAPIFAQLETNLFRAAPMFGVCVERFPDFLRLYSELRGAVKRQSEHWPTSERATRDQLYRLLYGGRAAVEEAMLQLPRDGLAPLLAGEDEPSATPSALVQGVKLHSGDILLSRGGAATSALIARGNDYPGNFSHVAVLYVDANTQKVSVIESHIECGVLVSPLEKYLADTKLRIMALRLRSDLIKGDPMLPHRAALRALQDATNSSVAYDFAMDQSDPSKKFCSEVAFWAYEPLGVNLWAMPSRMSAPGTVVWLSSLGVRHFETQEPADLEYDPQLRVVAEWRDLDTLFKDHVHNAIIDVMLEEADAGAPLGYDWARLPLARLAKGYSAVLNWFWGGRASSRRHECNHRLAGAETKGAPRCNRSARDTSGKYLPNGARLSAALLGVGPPNANRGRLGFQGVRASSFGANQAQCIQTQTRSSDVLSQGFRLLD